MSEVSTLCQSLASEQGAEDTAIFHRRQHRRRKNISGTAVACRRLLRPRAAGTLDRVVFEGSCHQCWHLPGVAQNRSCCQTSVNFHWTASPLCATPWPPNRRVNYLIVEVRQEPDAKVALLCEMLKKNRYIERLKIRIEKAGSAKEILRALTANAAVNFLCINMPVAACEEATEAFSDMLSRNNAITGMSMLLEGENAQKFLDSIAKAMSRNKRIVSFSSQFDCRIYVPFSIRESVRRNQCSLNRAVEFVLNRRDDRRGAECFELFVGTPCMMTQLTTVGGIADVEARLKIVAAKHRIQDNYFVLTGIVRRHMVCWPADAKQIDALNAACWRAIASFLRLTDVCFQ
ncbi:hypothetical protein MTO96_035298 [Rhipicephalus appendiculatus]